MMKNLFSIFDPSSSFNLNLNWMIILMILMFMPKNKWLMNSYFIFLQNKMIMVIMKDIKNNFKKNKMNSYIIIVSFFFFICLSNILSLFPYIFTSTAHIMVSLTLVLPFWFSFFLKNWLKHSNIMFSHLVPIGTPIMLSFFMVLIETISNLMRPFTLAVRLTANMIAGHLLVSLLSETLNSNSLMYIFCSFFLNLLIILEISVCIIQSYVFMTLMSLYFNEI